jgi:hypothetical protein
MTILYHILLNLILFSTIYPLAFWITPLEPPVYPFHKYHLRITNFSSGIAVLILLFMPLSATAKGLLVIWKIVLAGVSVFYWKKRQVNYWAVTMPYILGLAVSARLHNEFFLSQPHLFLIAVLSAFLFCTIFFINHLCVWNIMQGQKSFALVKIMLKLYLGFLVLRLGWDSYYFMVKGVVNFTWYKQPPINPATEPGTALPLMGVLLAVILPSVAASFLHRNLSNNSFPWALGFLLPVLLITLIGEIVLRVVWNQYGILF